MENQALPQKSSSPSRWDIFLSSFFFVLGFSVVFSLVGVLLQTVLESSSYTVQEWLGRIGGAIIILFGLVVLRLLKIPFLERDHKLAVKTRFSSRYLTSFVFGAAFAVGWTPCVSAALGAILALAATAPGGAFVLLMAYALGIGLPFLLVGLFTSQAQNLINRAGRWLEYFQYFFGVVLIILGILVFVGQLNRVANLEFVVNFLDTLGVSTSAGENINSLNPINLGIAFFAGLASFLSPCILPLIPGFISYLASTTPKKSSV
ncbi:MAG: cytochrome c bioproteinis protein [Parcubacteria group bacterium Gr01-1014_20]|nr:MAG: cytochrome c bioproteinis protein [Parcubacteria group bacterium Gr01-1014_20]